MNCIGGLNCVNKRLIEGGDRPIKAVIHYIKSHRFARFIIIAAIGTLVILLCNLGIKQMLHRYYAAQLKECISDSQKTRVASIDCILSQSNESKQELLSAAEKDWISMLGDLNIQSIGFDDYPENSVLLLVIAFKEDGKQNEFADVIISENGELYITFHDYRYLGYSQNVAEFIREAVA